MVVIQPRVSSTSILIPLSEYIFFCLQMKFNVGVDLIYNGFYSTELDYSLTFCLFYLVGKEEIFFSDSVQAIFQLSCKVA